MKDEKKRKAAEQLIDADVAVIGGGPAGVCAAIAAARHGANTVLLNNRPVLGGNSSSEIRVWSRGAVGGGNLFAEEMGIWGELKLRNLHLNPDGNPVFWDDILLEAVNAEKKLNLFLNTHMYAAEASEHKVTSVTAVQLGSEKEFKIRASVFVDATGDGTLGYFVQIPFMLGKEASKEFGESLAPEREEKSTLGNTLFFFTERREEEVPYSAPDYACSMQEIEEIIGRGGRVINEKLNGCDYWWFELGGNENTIEDNQDISFSLKRLSLGVWNYIKNSGKYDASHLTLSWEGNWCGKRESRRMRTADILTQQDVLFAQRKEDAAFYGGWYMDFHPSDGIYAKEDFCTQLAVHVYPLPFECLYTEKVENLLFAGRNIGVTHVAFTSSRIMNTCALSGQAAGTLAAEMSAEKSSASEIVGTKKKQLQRCLYEEDILLPWAAVPETGILNTARISVSSEEDEGNAAGQTGQFQKLGEHSVLVLPGAAAESEFLLRSDQDRKLSFQYECTELPLIYRQGETVQSTEVIWKIAELQLKKGENRIAFFRNKKEQEGFLTLRFQEAKGIELGVSARQLCGFLLVEDDTAEQLYPLVFLNGSRIYGKENLTDGFYRCFQQPHLWISKEEDMPWIRICFPEEKRVERVELYLNPDLSRELCSSRAQTWAEHHRFHARKEMPPMLARHIEVWTSDGKWLLASCRDNTKRHVNLVFPAQFVKGLEIRLHNYGAKAAEVFELRVF